MPSRYLNARYRGVTPYVPGEQPRDRTYVKLNANETSVPPSPAVRAALDDALVDGLGRYADPHCTALREAVARALDLGAHGLDASCVFCGNGSDEVLGLLFLTCLGEGAPLCFPDVTYGFYRDYAGTFGVPARQVPLRADLSLDVDAFAAAPENVVFPNPNAPTGLAVEPADVERIAAADRGRLVIVDEAYVDYGAATCVPLVASNPNLVVVHTMSKSYNLAGAHVGWCVCAPDLAADLADIKFSLNPFNLSAPTMAIAIAALGDRSYHDACVSAVISERARTTDELVARGFTVLPSLGNFVFATHPALDAVSWNAGLRERGVLCRHFDAPRTRDWLRVTIGTRDEMDAFLSATDELL